MSRTLPRMRNEDAAKRFSERIAYFQAVLTPDELLRGRYMIVRLSDGGGNNTAYDTRADAVRDNRNSPSRAFYFLIPTERVSAREADSLLWYAQTCYDNGSRQDEAHALNLGVTTDNSWFSQ